MTHNSLFLKRIGVILGLMSDEEQKPNITSAELIATQK